MAPTGKDLQQSSLSLALAGRTESVAIPKPRDLDPGQNTYAQIFAKSAPPAKTGGLPTPPNSISPSLPPQASTYADGQSPPEFPHFDSDIDLDDAIEHAKEQDSPHKSLADRNARNSDGPDAFGDITPYMLAKHHLPGILVQHGPLAIRHVMGYLTTSVPGFSGIPPAKARRLVVNALEGRGEDGLVGGLNPKVIFEKVGWGRWSAKKRGQEIRPRPKPTNTAIPIPQSSAQPSRMPHAPRRASHLGFSPLDHKTVAENDADNMSLDGTVEFRKPVDPDLTDEEDWASMGAEALRSQPDPQLSGSLRTVKRRLYPIQRDSSRTRGITKRPSSHFAKSLPPTSVLYGKQHQPSSLKAKAAASESLEFSSFMNTTSKDLGSQDREAVQALLSLSSF